MRVSNAIFSTPNAETPFNSLELKGVLGCKSLTMTYFHTGIRTIIGAKSFHFPVRDGKEWGQLAMVIRHNFLPGSRSCDLWWLPKRIHRVCKSFWGLLAISVLFDCADLSR